MTTSTTLYGRKFSLLLVQGENALDLSSMHCRFRTVQADFESPNSISVRVYNLSDQTLRQVQEFGRVVVQAGYEGNFGVVFDGTIKQFGIGRENAKDTYLDIFASDGDLAYNFAFVNKTLSPGASDAEVLQAALDEMSLGGVYLGYKPGDAGVTYLPRGKVAFALGRNVIRTYAQSKKMTWSIQNGKIQLIPLDSYKPGEIPDINAMSGMVGQPEQTAAGVTFRHLLNPRFSVGQAIRIDNKSVNQVIAQKDRDLPVAYNSLTQALSLAKVSADGLYRLLIAEHEGDTRGPAWYTHCTAMAIDISTGKVKNNG